MKEKKKIKILVSSSDSAGCGSYRSIWPHQYIQEKYTDEFDIDIMMAKDLPKDNPVEFFKQYDIVSYHKQLDKKGTCIDTLNFLGIPTVLDLDDSYTLSKDHPLYLSSIREHWGDIIVNHIRKSDYVTTTTSLYAKELQRHNKNVIVLPNAVDPEFMPQFKQEKKKSNRIRFGLVCGSTHLHDIELMQGIATLPQDIMDKIQICLCGFDTRGMVSMYNKETGEVTRRNIQPHESVWCKFQSLVTNNLKTVSPEHKEYLLKYIPEDDPFDNEPYRRFWTKDINNYAKHYENVDVLLAPLKINEFNVRKSQLKAIECAYTDTALVASEVGPYTIDLTPYIEKGGNVNPEGNSLLVDPSKNHKLWAKYITYIVNNPECIDVMKANIKRDLYDKYSLENVTKDRVELYRKLYAEKNQ